MLGAGYAVLWLWDVPLDSFSDSATVSYPKCVVFSSFCCFGGSARRGVELENGRLCAIHDVIDGIESRNLFAARGTKVAIVYDDVVKIETLETFEARRT